MPHPLTLPPACALALLATTLPSHAQYVGGDLNFGATMMNQNLGNTAIYQNNMDRLGDERRQLDAQRPSAAPARPSSDIIGKTENAVLAALSPEYERRRAALGQRRADAWMQTASSSAGRQVGSLHGQYLQRVQREGRQSADRWYIAQARAIGQRQVAAGPR